MISLETLERILIRFVFEYHLNEKWRGENIPPPLFRSFLSHVRSLSDSFTSHRKEWKPGYLRTKEFRSAYVLFFHLASLVRTLSVLKEMEKRNLPFSSQPRILELGAGSAASSWAVFFWLQTHKKKLAEVVAGDRERGVLREAKELWRFLHLEISNPEPPFRTFPLDLGKKTSLDSFKTLGQFDLILCCNVASEVPFHALSSFQSIFRSLIQRNLSPEGYFLLIEPALQKTARYLSLLRSSLLKIFSLSIPIPCGHEDLCPLLKEPRDWCHFEELWDPPPLRKRMEKGLGHVSGSLKYSYLLFQKKSSVPWNQFCRVLSPPLFTPQGKLLLLCTPREKLTLKYDSRSGNLEKILNSCQRGDLLEIGALDLKKAKKNPKGYGLELTVQPDFILNRK